MTEQRVPQAQIDDANADIVEVIGRFVPLKKAGKEYSACCPFHDERSPSFSVNAAKGVYHCFGCGATGNAIKFVMDHLGVGFRDAVETINGRISLDSAEPVTRRERRIIVRCDLPGHVEDPEKAATKIALAEHAPTHPYFVAHGTSCVGDCLVYRGALLVPLINHAGATVNAAAITADGRVFYAAGGRSYGAAAILEPINPSGLSPVICADYAMAWRAWWNMRGQVKVLCAIEYENLRWMLANCSHMFGRVACWEGCEEEWRDYALDVVSVRKAPGY